MGKEKSEGMRFDFNEVSIRTEKKCSCVQCGKRLTRRKKFFQTLSPWNKNADGTVRTRTEVMQIIQKEAADWRLIPEMCKACKELNNG